jgi:uncharacterized protein (TIGR00369 family)
MSLGLRGASYTFTSACLSQDEQNIHPAATPIGPSKENLTMSDSSSNRTYGVTPTEIMKTMTGLEFLQRMASGEFPAPPIGQGMGFGLIKVERGEVIFSGRPTAAHYNPLGTVHGGYAATLLDSCMGCVVHSVLPAGTGYTTLEIKINYVRALTDKVPLVMAIGKIIHAGRRAATAEGRLVDEKGTLYAHGTTTCLVFEL